MGKQALYIIAIAVLAAIGLFVIGYQNISTQDQVPSITTDGNNQQPIGGSAGEVENNDKIKNFVVEGEPYKFTPSEIRVKKGDIVRVTFKNVEGFHDWVIDEFNIRTKQIQAEQSETVQFVADKEGTFEYYCSVGNHRQMGMEGKLIVE